MHCLTPKKPSCVIFSDSHHALQNRDGFSWQMHILVFTSQYIWLVVSNFYEEFHLILKYLLTLGPFWVAIKTSWTLSMAVRIVASTLYLQGIELSTKPRVINWWIHQTWKLLRWIIWQWVGKVSFLLSCNVRSYFCAGLASCWLLHWSHLWSWWITAWCLGTCLSRSSSNQ